MKNYLAKVFVSIFLIPLAAINPIGAAADSNEIDVNYLQTCLKQEGSTLDVLVLMDSSRSLRDATEEEKSKRIVDEGSDPEKKRGPILKSSLKLLRTLASESDRELRISLRNFGNNESGIANKEGIEKLKEKWIDWTSDTSDQNIDRFVENALYDNSPGTQWAEGLKTAREAFNKRFSDPSLEGKKSCPIMFWITDGAPDNPTAEKSRICQRKNEASIEWFRERNILVLGGLLRPLKGSSEDASLFGPIVTGVNCGSNEEVWTRGSVIEADDINALAWGFVGLIAKIKNLMNLGAENGAVVLDPGTRVLEVFIKGNPTDWQIKTPDGSIFCSKTQLGNKCEVDEGKDTGILTIRMTSTDSALPSGRWIIDSNNQTEDSTKVFGGVNGKLFVSDDGKSIEEDQQITYKVQLQNPDGSAFDITGYNSITICGTVESTQQKVCKESPFAEITLLPGTTDKSIPFEATLVSAQNSERKYRFFQTVRVKVEESNKYPSLVCPSSTKEISCILKDVPNKNKPGESNLKVVAAKSGESNGKIYLLGYSITSDQVTERGNEKFLFRAYDSEGSELSWNDESKLLSPNQEIRLFVSTDVGGQSEIKGNIKYVVVQDGKKVTRQLDFVFNVKNSINELFMIALILAAYVLTVGIPYLYLLAMARRSAVLSVPDDLIAYSISPIRITEDGRLVSFTENGSDMTLNVPNQKKLIKQEIESGLRSVQVGPALVEVIPPKWNPFVEPRTRVTIPGHHILSTYDRGGFQQNDALFSSSLANEALVYFPTNENLNPVIQTQVETNEKENQMAVFASAYEERIKEEPLKKVGEVIGEALVIIPFLSTYKKVLQEVTTKVINSSQSFNVRQEIDQLRQERLENLIAEREAAKKAAELQSGKELPRDKKKSKKGSKSVSKPGIEDEGMDSNPFVGNNDKRPDIWGTDGDDFPGEDKKGPSIWG